MCGKTLWLSRVIYTIIRVSHRGYETGLHQSDWERCTYTSTFDSILFSEMTVVGQRTIVDVHFSFSTSKDEHSKAHGRRQDELQCIAYNVNTSRFDMKVIIIRACRCLVVSAVGCGGMMKTGVQ